MNAMMVVLILTVWNCDTGKKLVEYEVPDFEQIEECRQWGVDWAYAESDVYAAQGGNVSTFVTCKWEEERLTS